MFQDFSDQANTVMLRAGDKARELNHEYVGTEHILLALVSDESCIAAKTLLTLGVDENAVRAGVESFVQRGTETVTQRTLPLTPRSNQVLEFAREEARDMCQKLVDTEHLLFGLLREHDGVAGHILRGRGVDAGSLRAEALKTRISLMKIVERAVRPVQSSIMRKRKMREELFAHLSGIFEEELARLASPAAALEKAARRFGEPAALTRELETALPQYERVSAFFERWFQYRAPESAARYSLRISLNTFWILAAILGMVTFGVVVRYGWIETMPSMAGLFAAILLLTPPLQFAISLALIKMRDAMWGVFGSRKSWLRVGMMYLAIAAASQLYLMGVAAIARWNLDTAFAAARVAGVLALVSALSFIAIAYFKGPGTIRDTQWALLDIETA